MKVGLYEEERWFPGDPWPKLTKAEMEALRNRPTEWIRFEGAKDAPVPIHRSRRRISGGLGCVEMGDRARISGNRKSEDN